MNSQEKKPQKIHLSFQQKIGLLVPYVKSRVVAQIKAVALIVLGPQKLPEIARKLGRGLAEFRRTSDDLRRSILLGDEPQEPPPFTDSFPSPPEKKPGENGPETSGQEPSEAPSDTDGLHPYGEPEAQPPKNRDEG